MSQSNPNRIGDGGPHASGVVMSDPVTPSNMQNPAVSPTGLALVKQAVVKVGTTLVASAVTVLAAKTAGVEVPPTLLAIATLVIAIGSLLGIVSPGLRAAPPQ
jgi:hypothetical protein